jgi:hypothetical protein
MAASYERRSGFETIPDHYRFAASALVDDGEEFHCYGCGFFSQEMGTPHYGWLRSTEAPAQPLIITLCHGCQGQLGGAQR